MKRVMRWVLLVAAFAITSCTTPYVEPDSANSATLTFVNNTDRPVGLQGFQVASDCSGGKIDFNKTRGLGLSERLMIRVKAGEPFSYVFGYNRIDSPRIEYALQPATFVPRAGGSYQSEIIVRGDRYDVTLEQLAGNGRVPEPSFKLRTWRAPLTENGSFCE